MKRTLRTCDNGHKYYKSSDCPTCPACEKERRLKSGMLAQVAAPARRALESAGIGNEKNLSGYAKSEILELHGMGPGSMLILKKALKEKGLTFKNGKSKKR